MYYKCANDVYCLNFISRFANLEITTICDRQAGYGLLVIRKNKAVEKGLQNIFATIFLTQVFPGDFSAF